MQDDGASNAPESGPALGAPSSEPSLQVPKDDDVARASSGNSAAGDESALTDGSKDTVDSASAGQAVTASMVEAEDSKPAPSTSSPTSNGLDVEQELAQPGQVTDEAPTPRAELSTAPLDVPPPIEKERPPPPVPSTRKRPSKHVGPPKPILRPPGSSHAASQNALITGVAAAASLLPQNAKPALASFLQNINTRLAQGGVGVQVPIPHALTPGTGTISGHGLAYSQQSSSQSSRASQQQSPQQLYSGYGASGPPSASSSQAGTSASALLNGVLRRFSGAPPTGSSTNGPGTSGYFSPSRGDTHLSRSSTALGSVSLSPSESRRSTATEGSAVTAPVQPSIRPLRRVQFRPTLMTVTYPIVNTIAPADEDATRRRVEAEHRALLAEMYGHVEGQRSKGKGKKKTWTIDEVEDLYTRCCRIRQEWPLKKMRQVFQEARHMAGSGAGSHAVPLRTLDLSTIPLDQDAVDPLADFLSVDFGLDKLVLENCMLTDEGLKAILHALLISGTLPNLSLASNKKIKAQGWRYVALFIRRAQALRYLDLSENSLNKAALADIVAALERAPRELISPASERRMKKDGRGAFQTDGDADEVSEESASRGVEDEGPELQPLLDEIPLMPAAPLLRSNDASSVASSSTSSFSNLSPPTAHYSQLSSLRLENCSIKTSSLETLAQGVRASDLRHLSLRRNKISNAGAAALALVLKDYPDVVSSSVMAEGAGLGFGDSLEAQAAPYAARTGSLPLSMSGRQNEATATNGGGMATIRKDPRRTSHLLSPTESSGPHFTAEPMSMGGSAQGVGNMSPVLPQVPDIISSGGVTSKRMTVATAGVALSNGNSTRTTHALSKRQGSEARPGSANANLSAYDPALAAEQALAQAKAQRDFLASLPRVGQLLTLDLKSNDVGSGVVYLAQALKKNRTLRVLNLSDCNIDMAGLVAMADMLKYNSTLETLDLSHNPCCGPGLEGIATLRTAFTINSGLKRLFLSDTDLSSEGAICLAEFLPEAKSLIHLDLTENYDIDIAGVMALAVSLRMNNSLRCLDLNVPPNNPEFSRLSQDILQCCIRNTEEAQRRATQRGIKQPIAAPIYRSAVARAAKAEDAQREAEQIHRSRLEGVRAKRDKKIRDTLDAAQECAKVLADLLNGPGGDAPSPAMRAQYGDSVGDAGQAELLADLLAQSKRLREKLAVIASTLKDGRLLALTLQLNDELEGLATRGVALQAAPPPTSSPALSTLDSPYLSAPSQTDSGLSSPSFSIGSDDEDDEPASSVVKENLRLASQTLASSSLLSDRRLEDDMNGGDEDEDQSLSPGPASVSSSSATRQLPSLTINIDGLEAEKIQPPEEELDEGAPSPAEHRAKGQLSEEGEIFRKAKSLMLVEEAGLGSDNGDEEDEGIQEVDGGAGEDGGAHATTSGTVASSTFGQPSIVEGASSTTTRSRQRRTPSTDSAASHSSKSSGGSGSTATGADAAAALLSDPDVSGEMLRREILEADVPRVARSHALPASASEETVRQASGPSL